MKKVEVIFQIDKIDEMKNLCQELGLGQMILYEVKVFNPDLIATKKYRGAQYQVELQTKMKAEFYLEEEKTTKAIDIIKNKIIDTKKGDACVTF